MRPRSARTPSPPTTPEKKQRSLRWRRVIGFQPVVRFQDRGATGPELFGWGARIACCEGGFLLVAAAADGGRSLFSTAGGYRTLG